ncbi:MAG: TonB-dependent receptor, partial [Aliifodinibius sp.]|nr:TonB-dependent receptor [Fodinibius sp.]NIY27606.1 TonB-dependent receptor [Fodinibius sp.]
KDWLEARIDISKNNWQFRGGLQSRDGVGSGVGVAEALDPNGEHKSERWNADLTYNNDTWVNNLDLTAQVSFLNTSQ